MHKHRFKKHRNRRNRRTMNYKCQDCPVVIVVKKRTIHRLLTNKYKGHVQLKYLVTTTYPDTKDPGYAEYVWRELFGYEENHG